MSLRVPRKDPELAEAIEQLEARYNEAGKDTQKAWASLSETELEFVFREVNKCLTNPRYYLLNYHFIRSKKAVLQPLWPFWDSQEVFLECFESQFNLKEAVRIIVLKARQLGLTTISVAFMCWLAFLHPNTHALSMSDDENKVDVNFGMARIAWENLPWYLKPEKRYDVRPSLLGFDRVKEADRTTSLGLQSLLYFEAAGQPGGSAYSKSLYGAHLAEVARYRNSSTITEGIFGSLVNYKGSIGIMESTARGRQGTFYKLCRAAERKKFNWKFVFIEWFREPGYSVSVPENFEITPEEESLSKKVSEEMGYDLRPEQLAWRRQKKEEFEAAEGTDERFAQEFPINPTEAFISTGKCAFSKKRLTQMIDNFCRSPRWVGDIRLNEKNNLTPHLSTNSEGNLWIWEMPAKNATYYIAADPSMGIDGGDPACIQTYCVPEDINQPLRQVARWHGYKDPTQFARVLAAIGYLYNTAEISPECNTITTVASDLVKVLMYPKWYRWMREDKAKNAFSNWIGWQTNFKNKNELIARFREALNEWTVVIRCEEDIDEMLDFVEVEEGTERFEGMSHDDAVMAHMICYYCCTQLRPRSPAELEEKKPPSDVDFCNTDYSMYYDRDNPEYGHDRDGTRFDEL